MSVHWHTHQAVWAFSCHPQAVKVTSFGCIGFPLSMPIEPFASGAGRQTNITDMEKITLKHLVFTSAIIGLALSSFAIAQTPSPAPAPGQEKLEAVAQVLNLSPQQRSQLEPIVNAERPKVQAVMQDPNLTPKEKKSKLKHIHAQTDPLVQSILSPTQYQQWQTIRNDELENMGLKK